MSIVCHLIYIGGHLIDIGGHLIDIGSHLIDIGCHLTKATTCYSMVDRQLIVEWVV